MPTLLGHWLQREVSLVEDDELRPDDELLGAIRLLLTAGDVKFPPNRSAMSYAADVGQYET